MIYSIIGQLRYATNDFIQYGIKQKFNLKEKEKKKGNFQKENQSNKISGRIYF